MINFYCACASPQTYGFTRLTANSTTLVWEYIHNDDNKVYDTLVLTKSGGSGSVSEDRDYTREEVEKDKDSHGYEKFQLPNSPVNEL